MGKLPKRFEQFMADHPDISRAYGDLGRAVATAGPLDVKTCALVKLGISIGARQEGGARSNVRKALEAGVTPAELRHAVIQATTSVGFATMMAGMTWVEDVLEDWQDD